MIMNKWLCATQKYWIILIIHKWILRDWRLNYGSHRINRFYIKIKYYQQLMRGCSNKQFLVKIIVFHCNNSLDLIASHLSVQINVCIASCLIIIFNYLLNGGLLNGIILICMIALLFLFILSLSDNVRPLRRNIFTLKKGKVKSNGYNNE